LKGKKYSRSDPYDCMAGFFTKKRRKDPREEKKGYYEVEREEAEKGAF